MNNFSILLIRSIKGEFHILDFKIMAITDNILEAADMTIMSYLSPLTRHPRLQTYLPNLARSSTATISSNFLNNGPG